MRTDTIDGTRFNASNDLPSIRVTVLYETLEAALRARALLDCVRASMDVPALFTAEFWRLDWLDERSLRNIALSTAHGSELVIISTETTTPLPLEMEQWLNAWAARHEDHCSALIALHSREQTHRTRYDLLHDRLQRAARQKGVDFLYEFFEPGTARSNMEAPRRANAEDLFLPEPGTRGRWESLPSPVSRQTVE